MHLLNLSLETVPLSCEGCLLLGESVQVLVVVDPVLDQEASRDLCDFAAVCSQLQQGD